MSRSTPPTTRAITTTAALAAAAVMLGLTARASAVFTYDTSTTAHRNTTGLGAVGGHQYEGRFNSFLGTAIGPHRFITAQHIGGGVGDTITYAAGTPNAGSYTTTAQFSDPHTDLHVWRIDGTFSQYASLYDGPSEVGKTLHDFGRGAAVGDPVVVNGENKGWLWGVSDGAESYGIDAVTGISVPNPSSNPDNQRLYFNFSAQSGQAGFASGDSGGGLFIENNGQWQLAGINYGVTSPFQRDANNDPAGSEPDGNPFDATLYDIGGLWVGPSNDPTFYPDLVSDINGQSVATRIANRADWINSTAAVPEPTSLALLLPTLAAGLLPRRRRRRA